jgi:arylsulfatase A-like enzyme
LKEQEERMAHQPNILIFMTDQEQADVVSPDHPCHTPNADRLARDGIRFTRTYAPTAHCCPSRATFFTGLYPSRHGIYNNIFNSAALHTQFNPGVMTFAEPLRQAGYHLSFAGKWHVSAAETPADRGWEELIVTSKRGTHHGRAIDEWRAQPRQPEQAAPRRHGQIVRPGWGDNQLYDSVPDERMRAVGALNHDEQVVQAAVDALPRLAASTQPWLLFVGTIGPHDPFVVPESYLQRYDPATIPLPPSYHDTLEDKPRVYQRMRRQYWDQLSEQEVRESIAHYWAYCTYQDDLLGRVLDALDATGQADDTLVLFLSDHGDYCGAHGLYLKGVPAFREAYHVPCIARWPSGLAAPGRTVDATISLADFAPTFMELAGSAPPPDLSGRSMLPFLHATATPDDWPDAFYSQMNGVELYYSQRIVATAEYKYVYNGFDFDELYDLRRDPHELHNLADQPEYQAIKHELVQKMWRCAAREDDIIFNPYGTVALAPWGPADALGQ